MSITVTQERTSYPAVVGRIIAMQREQRGLEQSDIATEVGLSQSTWSRIETGQSALTIEQLAMAAKKLGTLPGQILGQADEVTSKLGAMNVTVEPSRPSRSDAVVAMIAVAVLTILIMKLMSK